MFINHYAILGLEPDAELVQITAAWKRLLRKFHPDLNQDDEDATEQAILINKAYEVLSDPVKRKRFDQQLEKHQRRQEQEEQQEQQQEFQPQPQQNYEPNYQQQPDAQNGASDYQFQQTAYQNTQSTHQPYAQQTGSSYSNPARKRKTKNSRYSKAITITGISLGALTAIPIGLFLVWTISGFDPLGIFRQPVRKAVVEKGHSLDETENENDPSSSAKKDESFFTFDQGANTQNPEPKTGKTNGEKKSGNSPRSQPILTEQDIQNSITSAFKEYRSEMARLSRNYSARIAGEDSGLKKEAGAIQFKLLEQLRALKSASQNASSLGPAQIDELINWYSRPNFADSRSNTNFAESDRIMTVNAQIGQLKSELTSGVASTNKWAVAGKWTRSDGIVFDIKDDGSFTQIGTRPSHKIKPVHQSGYAFASPNYLIFFYQGEATYPRVHKFVSETETMRTDKVFSMKKAASPRASLSDPTRRLTNVDAIRTYRKEIGVLQKQYEQNIEKIDAEFANDAATIQSQLLEKLEVIRNNIPPEMAGEAEQVTDLSARYSKPNLIGDESETSLAATDYLITAASQLSWIKPKLENAKKSNGQSVKRSVAGKWMRSDGILFDVQDDGSFRAIATRPTLMIKSIHESGYAFASPGFLLLFYSMEPAKPRVHRFIDDFQTIRPDKVFSLERVGSLEPDFDHITISYAKFGESRQTTRVEKYVQRVANLEGVTTAITSEGLHAPNPVGRFRELLRVTYQINNKMSGTLVFKNGEQVDIRQAILNHASENAKPFTKIEITYALFGDGPNKARCEEQIAAVASQINVTTPIITHGLSLRNPSGRVRKFLVFRYLVAGKSGEITLPYGQNVDLRKLIFDDAKVSDGEVVSRSDASPVSALAEQLMGKKSLPTPLLTEVDQAKKEIAAIFKDEYENTNKQSGLKRLTKLKEIAGKVYRLELEDTNAATAYAQYEVAIDLYRQSCFADDALATLNDFELHFEIDGLSRKLALFKYWRNQLPQIISDSNAKTQAFQRLSYLIRPFVRKAIATGNWQLASQYCETANELYLGAGFRQEGQDLQNLGVRVTDHANEASSVLNLTKELESNTNQPEKHLRVGKHLCFVTQDWQKGLTHLAVCGDVSLATCAKLDLESDNHESKGDAWWDLASKEGYEAYRLPMIARAQFHYLRALDFVTGVTKTKIEIRISQSKQILSVDFFFVDKLNETISPSIGMEFATIPKGQFTMGETEEYLDSLGNLKNNFVDESPRHDVTISRSFLIGKFEVTQNQWFKVMKSRPWYGQPEVANGGHNPASYVSWDEANEFCRRLSELDGKNYRLPTEAEWEYACRAGTETRFSFGDSDSVMSEYSWRRSNSWHNPAERFPRVVGTKKPNPWGLYDIHGNVWEWCLDYYSPTYYASSPGTDPLNSEESKKRVFRGGSYIGIPIHSRSASRSPGLPHTRLSELGFRVVREIESP